MTVDPDQVLQGGGVLAFASVVLYLLRAHLSKVETVLERVATVLERLEVKLDHLTAASPDRVPERGDDRADVTPIQGVRRPPAGAYHVRKPGGE